MTKLAPQRIHTLRTRGGNKKYRALRLDTGNFAWASEATARKTRGGNMKYRALRLDTGNFAWASEATARKTRIIDVVYNACNNELVRTKTLVKNAMVVIDAAPFRQWYESHYAQPLARKKGAKLTDAEEAVLNRKMSKKTGRKYAE